MDHSILIDAADRYSEKDVERAGEIDDACEWKEHPYMGWLIAGCNSTIVYKGVLWKYCPFCGKQIKETI